MLRIGLCPAGFLMLVYLSEMNVPLFAPLPDTGSKLPTTPHLHQGSHQRQANGDVHKIYKLNVSKREIHLMEDKHCEDA